MSRPFTVVATGQCKLVSRCETCKQIIFCAWDIQRTYLSVTHKGKCDQVGECARSQFTNGEFSETTELELKR